MSKNESNAIKGVGIILLVFHHLFRTVSKINRSGVSLLFLEKNTLAELATMSRVCVWLFAFITAYGLTLQLKKQDNGTSIYFIYRRIVKLLLPYQFVLLLLWISSFLLFPNKNPLIFYKNHYLRMVLEFLGINSIFGNKCFSGTFWYIGFAMAEIIIIPFVYLLVKNLDYAVLPLSWIALEFVNKDGLSTYTGGNYSNYLFIIILGVVLADRSGIEQIKKWYYERHRMVKLFCILASFSIVAFSMYIRNIVLTENIYNMKQIFITISAFGIILLITLIPIPNIFDRLLQCLGKHSMNIFLVHTAVYGSYPRIVYCSKNVILSTVTCVLISLTVSILIEQLKKIIQFNKLIDFLTFSKTRTAKSPIP